MSNFYKSGIRKPTLGKVASNKTLAHYIMTFLLIFLGLCLTTHNSPSLHLVIIETRIDCAAALKPFLC